MSVLLLSAALLLAARGGLGAEDAETTRAPRATHSMARFGTVVFELPLAKGVREWCRAHNKQYADDLRTGRRGPKEKLDYCASWDGRDDVCYITLRHGLSQPQQERVLGDAVAHCAINVDREIRRGT